MDEFLDIQKIKECISNLVKSSQAYDPSSIDRQKINDMHRILKLKKQINHLFNYRYDIVNHLFRYKYEVQDGTLEYFKQQSDTDWFVKIFGVREFHNEADSNRYEVTKNLFSLIKDPFPNLNGTFDSILIAPNGNTFKVGQFTTPTLAEIRESAKVKEIFKVWGSDDFTNHELTRNEDPIITIEDYKTGDILEKHHEFTGSTIQAASQLNALEFTYYDVTPRDGITNYQTDNTQGPACALACAAGTFARNYYYQTPEKQINYLDEFEKAIENDIKKYFTVTNGYLLINGFDTKQKKANLKKLNIYLSTLSQDDLNKLKNLIKTGLHQNVEIIFKDRFNLVDIKGIEINQVYASALSVSYNSDIANDPNWEKFATLVLEAQYEATLLAAINSLNHTVILTLLGRGAFGNKPEWIFNAIVTAIREVKKIKNKNFQIKLNIKLGYYSSIDTIINKAKIDEELLK